MSKKKSYRELKNEIIELKNVVNVRDNRIAVLLVGKAASEKRMQEYKDLLNINLL